MKPLMLTKREIKQVFLNHRDKLREHGVIWLGFFDSYVKYAANADCDIDQLVEFEELSFDWYIEAPYFPRKSLSEKD